MMCEIMMTVVLLENIKGSRLGLGSTRTYTWLKYMFIPLSSTGAVFTCGV